MNDPYSFDINPDLDLVLERTVDVSPELIWKAWTEPEHLKPWFTPAPWKTVGCTIDLRPGGRFETVMESPDGVEFPGTSCYLEIIPNRRLVWTNAMGEGFRPVREEADQPGAFQFTAAILLEPEGQKTRYTAIVMHKDADGRKQHAEMGFQEGWGKALDQLVDYIQAGMKSLPA